MEQITPIGLEPLAAEYRRRAALIAAAAVLCISPVDLLMADDLRAIAARFAWVAVLVAFGMTRPRAHGFDGHLVGAYSALTVAFLGWTAGPYYLGYLYALPFAAMVLFRHRVGPVLTVGLTALLAGELVMRALGERPVAMVAFLFLVVASTVLAGWGSRAFSRHQAAERASLEAQRQAQEALGASERLRARSERLAVLGQLAAGVAHEINNPLAYVKSSLDWIRHHLGAEGSPANAMEVREALADAEHGVQRIRHVVGDLSAFARASDDEVGGADFGEAVQEAVRLASLRIADIADVAYELGPRARCAAMPKGRLVQVVLNLLLNAADAIETTGRKGRIEIRARASGARVTLDVEDDGPGLPAGCVQHLFEPFFTTKGQKGTGLGLALSREYLERAGGSIEAGQSRLGGARFSIELPAGEVPPSPARPEPAPTQGR